MRHGIIPLVVEDIDTLRAVAVPHYDHIRGLLDAYLIADYVLGVLNPVDEDVSELGVNRLRDIVHYYVFDRVWVILDLDIAAVPDSMKQAGPQPCQQQVVRFKDLVGMERALARVMALNPVVGGVVDERDIQILYRLISVLHGLIVRDVLYDKPVEWRRLV